jgi:hypothetical protein
MINKKQGLLYSKILRERSHDVANENTAIYYLGNQ